MEKYDHERVYREQQPPRMDPISPTLQATRGRRDWILIILLTMSATVVAFLNSETAVLSVSRSVASIVAKRNDSDKATIKVESSIRPSERDNSKRRRVIVLTVWTHYPDLMKLQVATTRAFLNHSDHPVIEVVAVNNAVNATLRRQLDVTAAKLQVHGITVPDSAKFASHPSNSHANALNYAMSVLLGHGLKSSTMLSFPLLHDILLLLDSDMVLLDPTSLVQQLDGASLASPLQRRPGSTYMWPNLSVFSFGEYLQKRRSSRHYEEHKNRMVAKAWGSLKHAVVGGKKTPKHESSSLLFRELNFLSCYPECHCDTGGCTKLFLHRHPDMEIVDWSHNPCQELSPSSSPTKTNTSSTRVCQYWKQQMSISLPNACVAPEAFGPVFHMRSAGSNWRGCPEDFLRQRRRDLLQLVGEILPVRVLRQHNLLE